jgi:hypothetical protein
VGREVTNRVTISSRGAYISSIPVHIRLVWESIPRVRTVCSIHELLKNHTAGIHLHGEDVARVRVTVEEPELQQLPQPADDAHLQVGFQQGT